MNNEVDLEKELDALGLLEKAREIYAELGEDAAVTYIRSGYRLLNKVYHPDLNPQNPEKAKALQQRLNQAQRLLNRAKDKTLVGIFSKGGRAKNFKKEKDPGWWKMNLVCRRR